MIVRLTYRVRNGARSLACRGAGYGGFALALFVALTSCSQGSFETVQGQTMGTYYRVQADCPAREVRAPIAALLTELNAILSTYLESSELSRLNRAPVDQWLPVSAELYEVLEASLELSAASDGAFDVTVGPLVNLWGFGPDDRQGLPEAHELREAASRVGYQHLSLRADPRSVTKARPVTIDLSAIAKGYAVDRLSALLSAMGCNRHLVDIGGEVRASGRNAAGQWWRVGIEVPQTDLFGEIHSVVEARDTALATSGDYRNFVEIDGQRYSHTIDPSTGRSVRHRLASVTVIHPSAMWADGYATLLNVLGPNRAIAFASARQLPVYLLLHDEGEEGGSAGLKARYNEAMETWLLTP